MNKHTRYGIAVTALLAAASGCSNKAQAQTPTAPARMLTADTDVNQLVSGTIFTPSAGSQVTFQKLADGPFVLTDLFGYSATIYAVPAGQDCTLSGDPYAVLNGTNGRPIARVLTNSNDLHGRIVINANEELCGTWLMGTNISVTWSGFKPY